MEYIVVYLAFDNICQKILLTVVKIENFKKRVGRKRSENFNAQKIFCMKEVFFLYDLNDCFLN